MRDMVTMVQESGLNANICLYGGDWHVELYDADQQASAASHGPDLTDALSRAYNRYREARVAVDAKAQAG